MAATVVIGIPIVGKDRAGSWPRVTSVLAQTLLSVFRQKSQNYTLAVAYNDLPEGAFFEDPRITWLHVPPVESNGHVHGDFADKHAKLEVLWHWAASSGGECFYQLDGDDVISNRLVEYITASKPAVGFRVTEGYAFDGRLGLFSPLPHPALPHVAFDGWCGSSIVVRIDPTASPKDRFDILDAVFEDGHGGAAIRFAPITGSPATAVPFRSVLYRLNTGENTWLRYERNRGGTHLSDWVFDAHAFQPSFALREEFSLPSARQAA